MKCSKTQAMLICCAKRKLYAEEDVLQFRKEFEQGKHKVRLELIHSIDLAKPFFF